MIPLGSALVAVRHDSSRFRSLQPRTHSTSVARPDGFGRCRLACSALVVPAARAGMLVSSFLLFAYRLTCRREANVFGDRHYFLVLGRAA